MDYDELIGEIFVVEDEFADSMDSENPADEEFMRQLQWLNFEVRKNGIKGLGSPNEDKWDEEDSDPRIAFNQVVEDLARYSDETNNQLVKIHLINIRDRLLSEGINESMPYY